MGHEPRIRPAGRLPARRTESKAPMEGGTVGKTLILVALGVVALVFVGWLVLSLLGTLLKFAFYLLVGVVVVGGGVYLVGKASSAIRDGRFKQIR